MKILYAGQSLTNPIGGGELSARSLLDSFDGRHEINIVGAASEYKESQLSSNCYSFDYQIPSMQGLTRMPLLTKRELVFRHHIIKHIKSFKPKIIILQQPSFLRSSDILAGMALILFIRSPFCYSVWDGTPSSWKRAITALVTNIRFNYYKSLLERADLIVVNSSYMKKELFKQRKLDSIAIPPFIKQSNFVSCAKDREGIAKQAFLRDRIIFIGLDLWKGADIAIKLARLLPNRKFLFLTGNRSNSKLESQVKQLANVELIGWTDEMDKLYARSRLLLVPSKWAEPFGRIAVEAARHGIPSIATAIGGLVESVGKGGILLAPNSNIHQWQQAIAKLDDLETYKTFSQEAVKHSTSFSQEITFSKFCQEVNQRIGVKFN